MVKKDQSTSSCLRTQYYYNERQQKQQLGVSQKGEVGDKVLH